MGSNLVSIPTIVGMACMNQGFRSDLFRCNGGKAQVEKFLSNYGLALTDYDIEQLVKLTRELQFTAGGAPYGGGGAAAKSGAGGGPGKHTEDDKKRDKSKARLEKRVMDFLKPPDEDAAEEIRKKLIAPLMKVLYKHQSPGSLEGVFEVWNDAVCPVWPCDPTEM